MLIGGKMSKISNETNEKKSSGLVKSSLIGALAGVSLFGAVTFFTGCDMGGNGDDSNPISISDDGYWVIDGEKTEYKAEGTNGATISDIQLENEEGDKWGIKTRFKITLSDGEVVYSDWITNMNNNATYSASSEQDFMSLVSLGAGCIKLDEDVTLTSEEALALTQDLCINLNGHTLTTNSTNPINVENGITLDISNGSLRMNAEATTKASLRVFAGSTLRLMHVDYVSTGTALMAYGDAARLEVVDCNVVGGTYAVSTNALNSENYGVIIDLKDSTFSTTGDIPAGETVTNYDDTAVMINIPCEVTIDDCELYGDRQAMIVRGGDVVIKDSRLVLTGKYGDATKYLNSSWGNGNEVPMATLVIGDNLANNYAYETTCTIMNTTFISKEMDAPEVYAYGDTDEQDVVVNYMNDLTDSEDLRFVAIGNVDVNFEVNSFSDLEAAMQAVNALSATGVSGRVMLGQDISSDSRQLDQTEIDKYNQFISTSVDKGEYDLTLNFTPNAVQ